MPQFNYYGQQQAVQDPTNYFEDWSFFNDYGRFNIYRRIENKGLLPSNLGFLNIETHCAGYTEVRQDPYAVYRKLEPTPFIHIDDWRPSGDDDRIFKEIKGAVIGPIHQFYSMPPGNHIDYFRMNVRGCYNSDTGLNKKGEMKLGFREHLTNYLNYFEKYYDKSHQLLSIYAQFKWLLEFKSEAEYPLDSFVADLYRYIISSEANPILFYDISKMNRDNYIKMTSAKKDTRNPCLEYKDVHAELLMLASLYQKFMIPIISHYMYVRHTPNPEIRNILLQCFDKVYLMIKLKYGVDLYAKLYETSMANIGKSTTRDKELWEMQATRGINPSLHGISTLESIIMNAVPKYVYNESVICFNFGVITKEIKYKVTDIPYEFHMSPMSSSIRDEDNNSQTDKFESHMIKQNEAKAIQLSVNSTTIMEKLIQKYGPFYTEEIEYYKKRLTKDGKPVKNRFQMCLLNYMFMKEFDDTNAINYVNNDEYIMLMITAKRILKSYSIFTLADIIGGKVERTIARKSVNKAMMLKMKSSEGYDLLLRKYKLESIIEDTLFSLIAQTIASEFTYVDYYNKNIDGRTIEVNKDIICDEFLRYTLLI